MPVIKTLRIIIAVIFALFALLCLGMMLTAELTSTSAGHVGDYVNWAKAAGLLTLAVAFSLIALDGNDEVSSDLTSSK